MKTYDKLPAQCYVVRFEQFRGFYLEKHPEIEILEEKVYGVHQSKVRKVFSSFAMFTRNLGVILSGDKGMGKSLFAKMVCCEAVSKGIPVIIVDRYIDNIASYIERIEQEVVVLFDEFDKTYGEISFREGSTRPQSQLLSLFDGICGGKKMYIITCNNLKSLSDYFINRTGRFHYHFRFEYPTADEIREYLTDKLDKKYYGEIESVVSFSKRTSLNYDCLRAIAFELNTGIPLKQAVLDLNIINFNVPSRYNIILKYSNGLVAKVRNEEFDVWEKRQKFVWLSSCSGVDFVGVDFNTGDIEYDVTNGEAFIPIDKIKIRYETEPYCKEYVDSAKSATPEKLVFERAKSKNLHYML